MGNLYSNSDSSSDSSSSKILIKNTSPIQNLRQLKHHSILYPTYLKPEHKIMRVEDSSEHQVGVKQIRKSVKHSSKKSMERKERKSTMVLQCDSKNVVKEESTKRLFCTRLQSLLWMISRKERIIGKYVNFKMLITLLLKNFPLENILKVLIQAMF